MKILWFTFSSLFTWLLLLLPLNTEWCVAIILLLWFCVCFFFAARFLLACKMLLHRTHFAVEVRGGSEKGGNNNNNNNSSSKERTHNGENPKNWIKITFIYIFILCVVADCVCARQKRLSCRKFRKCNPPCCGLNLCRKANILLLKCKDLF